MDLLHGQIRPYAWGSRRAIAGIQGRPVPSEGPEAELWLGTHPGAPSGLGDGTLTEALVADPDGLLGHGVVEEFGVRLPYLFKLLAADAALSLQAHPDPVRAHEAYAAGYPGYADPYHKPELLVAVEEFDALCGFRDPEASARLLESFEVAALKPVVEALRAGSPEQRLRGAFELLMRWPAGEHAELVSAVVDAGRRRPSEPAHALAVDLGEQHPTDVGVVAALLLNRVRLAPDEAVWMPAGNLHAYLRGVGMEIMAASDNVLRGGLTPKRVDVPELLRVLRFEVLAEPVVRPVSLAPGLLTWPTPVREFALTKATVDGAPVTLPADGPRILFCLHGAVELSAGASRLAPRPGEAAFVGAGEPPVVAAGTGVVFQADTACG
jgi:mannose-6-phosphate isomerase